MLEQFVNKNLILHVINHEGEKIGPTYNTKIIRIVDTKNFFISAPSFDKYTIPLPINTRIRMLLKGADGEIYTITGIILNKSFEENKILLQTKIYNSYDKVNQKRAYFRIECNFNAEYRLLNPTEDTNYKSAFVKNISEGGICLAVNEDIYTDNLIEVFIWINKTDPIMAVCKIVNKTKKADTNVTNCNLRLRFVKISEKDRDAIIRYMFKKKKKNRS